MKYSILKYCFAVICFCAFSAQSQSNIRNYLHFDGEDDYVSIIDTLTEMPQLKIRDNVTIDMWIMFEEFKKPMTIISMGQYKSETVKRQILYSLTMQANKSILFEWESDNGSDVSITSPPLKIEENKWYYITVTRNVQTASVSFYLDGEIQGAYGFNLGMQPMHGNIGHCTLGAKVTEKGAVYFPFKGKLDHLRVWNVILDNDKIKKYTNRHFIGFEPELVANFPFMDGKCNSDNNEKNTHLFDFTENHNHGILYNFQLKGKESNWLCNVK